MILKFSFHKQCTYIYTKRDRYSGIKNTQYHVSLHLQLTFKYKFIITPLPVQHTVVWKSQTCLCQISALQNVCTFKSLSSKIPKQIWSVNQPNLRTVQVYLKLPQPELLSSGSLVIQKVYENLEILCAFSVNSFRAHRQVKYNSHLLISLLYLKQEKPW